MTNYEILAHKTTKTSHSQLIRIYTLISYALFYKKKKKKR